MRTRALATVMLVVWLACVAAVGGAIIRAEGGADLVTRGEDPVTITRPTRAPEPTTTLPAGVDRIVVPVVQATVPPTMPPQPPTTLPVAEVTPVSDPPIVPATVPAAADQSGRCGGDLPPCWVMMRESGGDPTAQNPTSTASGKWQFLDSTWAGFMGYEKARYAPEWVQDEKARQVWAGGAGCGHWSAC